MRIIDLAKKAIIAIVPYRVLLLSRRNKAKKELRMMTDSNASIKIASAIGEVLDNKLTQEEKIWIKRIESLRYSLEHSNEQIKITDYGAGSPNVNRSEKEMLEGVVVF